ncbi:MAG: tRNA glutamyl-Q(34) synthetase GluQRS [Gemmataceae bacterium]|nr:tRNA glutamyl-Q(34) synthetase GluQRS [Gemmataceae bacterium]
MKSGPMIRGRLAPSPTGAQHVGNARTYLAAWLSSRAQGGEVVLRIEDIDSPRIKVGATSLALEDLSWLGLDWDGEMVVQSKRLNHYRQALDFLLERELAYPCTCTRSEVQQLASAPHEDLGELVYPGTCSGRKSSSLKELVGKPHCLRFRTPRTPMTFNDGFHNWVTLNPGEAGGDFAIWRASPGPESLSEMPAYQLAVVVDDASQGVTEVIRGEDLIPSTPRQILLYQNLNLQVPAFTHIPLVVGPDGRRLAKRHGDTRLHSLRDKGVKAEALLGLLAWSCGWLEKPAPVQAKDLIPVFKIQSIPREPFVLRQKHLEDLGYSL